MQFNSVKTIITRNVKSFVPSVGSKKRSNYQQIDHKFHPFVGLNTTDLRLRKLLFIRFENIFNNKLVNNKFSNDINRRLVSKSYNSSNCLSVRNYSSKTGNQSSDSDSELYEDDEDLFHEPPKVRYGLLKVALVIILGTYAGALFAMFGANFLEEFEIFVKEDDDDDD